MEAEMKQVLAVLLWSIGCFATPSTGCTYGEVRLVGGAHQFEGMVEYCSESGEWSRVCDIPSYPWTDFEARLACNATGLGDVTNATAQSCTESRTCNSTGISLNCAETANNITNCCTADVSLCCNAMATCTVKNFCAHIDCPNNSACTESDMITCSPCQCDEGRAGRNCDQANMTAALCVPPCSNGGTCTAPNTCQCPDGTQGAHCEQTTEQQDSSNTVVIAVAVVVALLALLAAACLLIPIGIASTRRRKKKKGQRANEEMTMIPGNTTRNSTENSTSETEKGRPHENPTSGTNGLTIGQLQDTDAQTQNTDTDESRAVASVCGMYDIIKLDNFAEVYAASGYETEKKTVYSNSNSYSDPQELGAVTSPLQPPSTQSDTEHGYSQQNCPYSCLEKDYGRPTLQLRSTQAVEGILHATEAGHDELSHGRNTKEIYNTAPHVDQNNSPMQCPPQADVQTIQPINTEEYLPLIAKYDEVGPPMKQPVDGEQYMLKKPPIAEYDEVGPPMKQPVDGKQNLPRRPPIAEYEEIDPPMNLPHTTPPIYAAPYSPQMDKHYPINKYGEPCPQKELQGDEQIKTNSQAVAEYDEVDSPKNKCHSPIAIKHDQIVKHDISPMESSQAAIEYDKPYSLKTDHAVSSLPNQSPPVKCDKVNSEPTNEYDRFNHSFDHSHKRKLTTKYEEPHLLVKYSKLPREMNTEYSMPDSNNSQIGATENAGTTLPSKEQHKPTAGGRNSGGEYSVLGPENTALLYTVEEGKYSTLSWEKVKVDAHDTTDNQPNEVGPVIVSEGQRTPNHKVADVGGQTREEIKDVQRTDTCNKEPDAQSQVFDTQPGDNSQKEKGVADDEHTNTATGNNGKGQTAKTVQNQLAYSHLRHL